MDLSRWNGNDAWRDPAAVRGARWRGSIRVAPACESLESRQLLSAAAVLPVPSALAVAGASAELNALDPTTFTRLQDDLAKAEGHSRVSLRQADRLAQDEAALDRAIEAIGQGRDTPSDLLMGVQMVNDQIDHAFMGDTIAASRGFIAVLRGAAQEPVSWGRLKSTLAHASISPGVVQQTAHLMQVVARAAHVPPPSAGTFWNRDYNTLSRELGRNPDTNLGPGAADLDAVQVYFDAQVNHFIKG